jgi:hypothetical protein
MGMHLGRKTYEQPREFSAEIFRKRHEMLLSKERPAGLACRIFAYAMV